MIFSLLLATMAYLGNAQSVEVCKKCCEGIFKTGSGKGSWVFTNTNGRGWTADEDSIRYDFINDSRCGGSVNFRQRGTATFTYQAPAPTTVEFEMDGVAESSYELFEFYVDGSRVVRIQASNNNFCKVSTCNMCNVAMPKQSYTFSGGQQHTIMIKADSLDGYYHNNCFFAIKFKIQQGAQCNGCPSCTANPTKAPVFPTPRPTEFDPCLTRYTNKALNFKGKQTYSAERIGCHEDPECRWYTEGGKNVKRDGELKQVQGRCVKRALCHNVPNKKECLSRKDCFVMNNKNVRGWGTCEPLRAVKTNECRQVDPDEEKDLCKKSNNCMWSTKDTESYNKKECYPKPVIDSCDKIEKRRSCVRMTGDLLCKWERNNKGKKGKCLNKVAECKDIPMRPEDRNLGASCSFEAQKYKLTCYDNEVRAFLHDEGLATDGKVCSANPPCASVSKQNACLLTKNYSGTKNCVWGTRFIRTEKRQESYVENGCLELDCTTITNKNVCNQLQCYWKRAKKFDTDPDKCVFPKLA